MPAFLSLGKRGQLTVDSALLWLSLGCRPPSLPSDTKWQSRDPVYQHCAFPTRWASEDPGSVCSGYSNLCLLPLWSWPLPTFQNGASLIPGATWGRVTWAGVACQKSFLFHLLHWALLFSLFNWLGKEKVSWDVNKDNESLPKVKPSRRQWDVLIKWLSSEGDRVTVQEGDRLRATGSGLREKPLIKLANVTQRQLSSQLFPLSVQVREKDAALTTSLYWCRYYPWVLNFCDFSELKPRWI